MLGIGVGNKVAHELDGVEQAGRKTEKGKAGCLHVRTAENNSSFLICEARRCKCTASAREGCVTNQNKGSLSPGSTSVFC